MTYDRPALAAGICLAACLLAAAGGRAGDFWMSNDALRAAFAGQTIDGQYANGRTFRETYAPDGSLDYAEPAPSRRLHGHWSIIEQRFCTIYENASTGGCYRVRQVSANCFEFYFETRTEEEVRRATPRKPSWTARAWRIDRVATCEQLPLV